MILVLFEESAEKGQVALRNRHLQLMPCEPIDLDQDQAGLGRGTM